MSSCFQAKKGMTGGAPSHPLVVHQVIVHFGILDLVSLCKSPAFFFFFFRVIGAGFAKSYRLPEGGRFVFGRKMK